MDGRNFTFRLLLSPVIFAMAPAAALCKVGSSTGSVMLTATLGEGLIVADIPSAIPVALVPGGTALGSPPIAITKTWIPAGSRANLILDACFATAAADRTGGSANKPSSEIFGNGPTGTPTSATAFIQATAPGPAGAGLTLFTQTLVTLNRSANRTDNPSLVINLAAQPQHASSTDTGTLTIQVQAL